MCYVLLNDCTFQSAFLQLRAAGGVELPNPVAWWRRGCSCCVPPDQTSSRAERVFPAGRRTHRGAIHKYRYVWLGTQIHTDGHSQHLHEHKQHQWSHPDPLSSGSGWRSARGSTRIHVSNTDPPAAGLRHGVSPEAAPAPRPPQLLAPGTQEQLYTLAFSSKDFSVSLLEVGYPPTLIYKDWRRTASILTIWFSINPAVRISLWQSCQSIKES